MEARCNFAPASGNVFVAGQRQRYRHEWNLPSLHCEGADFLSSLFQWAPGLSDSRGETGCLCGFIVVRTKFSEETSDARGNCRKARRGSKSPGDHNVAASQRRLTLNAGGF